LKTAHLLRSAAATEAVVDAPSDDTATLKPARPNQPPAPVRRIVGYPCRSVRFAAGRIDLNVFVVDRLEEFVDADALLRDGDIPEPPYWAHLWVGSRALARHLAQSDLTGARALDVGCGVGLAGLAAAQLGAVATFIDYTADALAFVRASADLNRLDAHCIQADLRQPGLRGEFDLCLAADVTYDPTLQRALAAMLARHLARDGVAFCAESVRTVDRGFHEACREHGLATTERQLVEEDEGAPVVVRLTEVRRRERS